MIVYTVLSEQGNFTFTMKPFINVHSPLWKKKVALSIWARGNWDHSACLMLIMGQWEIPVREFVVQGGFATALAGSERSTWDGE